MANNIGITTETLPRIIGQTIDFDTSGEWNSITMFSGQLDLGAIIFDEAGTWEYALNSQETIIITRFTLYELLH